MSLRAESDQLHEEAEARLRASFTAEDKLAAVTRELAYRRRVYERAVADKRMTKALADRQIAVFESIEADYRKACKGERLL